MKEYWRKVYKTRYFWSHLARNDLKARFRRSKIGLLWTVIQPLMLTIILSFVFSTVFKESMGEYALYVLSGIIVWNMLQTSIVGGGNCLLASEQYIRQFNHPISIYTLRYTLVTLATFFMEMIALIIWVLGYSPSNIVMGILSIPITILLYAPLIWGLSTIAGYSGTKYRDYPQVMVLLMQMLYYISPVFFKKEMFLSNKILELIFYLNPITHLLTLVRNPFVYGIFPKLDDYLYVIGTNIIFILWAYYVNYKNQRKVIFYL